MYAKLLIESQKLKNQKLNLFNVDGQPKISIIQTVRSQSPCDTHMDSILSVVSQTYRNWELIIVNDGGVLGDIFNNQSILDNKTKIKIINCSKIGRANALNVGLKHASGDYISYLDVDNYYDEHFLEVMLNNSIKNNSDLIYCAQLRFADDSVTSLYNPNIRLKDILKCNKIDLNSIMHKVDLTHDNQYNTNGFFDRRLTRLIDWALLLKLMGQDINIHSIPLVGNYYFDGYRPTRISSNDEFNDNASFIKNLILNKSSATSNIDSHIQTCQFCDHTGGNFMPSGTKSPVFDYNSVLGGGYRLNNLCPKCGSIDRHRSIHFIINEISINKEISDILHIAPEPALTKFVDAKFPNAKIVRGDKYPNQSNILKMDLTNIPFENSSFDLIICSHVLEHIKQDKKAISEILRVLKPGGYAICPTIYSEIISTSMEEPLAINYTENERMKKFGQSDHVKLYEKNDYISRFTDIGLKHIQFDQDTIKKFNTNTCEMFVFQKLNDASDDIQPVEIEQQIIPIDFSNELGGWAIEKDLVDLIDTILNNFDKPSLVEFGSGKGSKSLAYLIKKHNGKMSSIEGNEAWANLVDNELELHNLSDVSQVLYSPLTPRIELGVATKFYSETFLDYLDDNINLLIVDGPQGDISPIARYPALKSIYSKLDKNKFYVILDDYNRVDEKLIVEMWKHEYPNLHFLPLKLENKQVCIISNVDLDNFIKFSIQ